MKEPATAQDILEAFGLGESKKRIDLMGKRAGDEGTQRIETELARLREGAAVGDLNDNHPGDYLRAACEQLWVEKQNLEPVLYLYDKYYEERVPSPDDPEGPWLGLDFPGLAAEIASQTSGADRTIVIQSAIGLISAHTPEMEDRVRTLAYFALELGDNGAKAEGLGIVKFLQANAPKDVTSIPDVRELLAEGLAIK